MGKMASKIDASAAGISRRVFVGFSTLGALLGFFFGSAWARLQEARRQRVEKEMVKGAEAVAGLEFTEPERDLLMDGVNENLAAFEKLRAIPLDNSVPPALQFNPIPAGVTIATKKAKSRRSRVQLPPLPSRLEDVAFWPVTYLGELLRTRKVSSRELTQMYLDRLRRYDPHLKCAVTLTEERALERARRADEELATGKRRGPLHGLPWGAKDLLATRGYRTTWGSVPFKDQMLDYDATVVQRLDQAGAVLVAKLSLGELAWGDVWFGGQTRNPWNLEQGSSGSSAAPASATAAGLVAFSIGSETYGSIVSPCTRCGVTGLRPTFGRVSRFGAMALSWSMDKLGPICRSVEDCALVFQAIYGPDGKDLTVVDVPFAWDARADLRKIRVGFVQSAFEDPRRDQEAALRDAAVLDTLRSLGVDLVPVALPDLPVEALQFILNAEAAAAFDELTRSNRDDLMVRQVKNAWPNVFRHSRLIPAVEYIQANRVRTLLMQEMAKVMAQVDVYVVPTFGGNNLLLTNLTGHPCVVVPNGFTEKGTPTSITFVGKLFGEADLLRVAKAYQDATDFHLRHPALPD
ncbi:MAG: amidase [bacterium]|jgi:Asp-tRNA(Asn)/Glu-tRNA(Gln) amidotransferase A subunit family amidase|nr:amidase [candidate division KSB1 bacterium]MDH7560035.1 amidase [bacterium]